MLFGVFIFVLDNFDGNQLITLVSRIIVQVGIKVQVSKIWKINKSAGWNEAVQLGILGNLLL